MHLDISLEPSAGCLLADPLIWVPQGESGSTTCTVDNIVEPNTILTVSGDFSQGGYTIEDEDSAPVTNGYFVVEVAPSVGNDNSVYDVTVSSVNNFQGYVNLSCNPTELGELLSNPLWVPAGESNSTECSVGACPGPGTPFTVQGSFPQGGNTIYDSDTVSVSPA